MTAPTEQRIYEQELPSADDPDVVALAQALISEARAAQTPGWGIVTTAGAAIVLVLVWGQLNAAVGFEMEWLLMAASTVVFGVALGFLARRVGRLFELKWAVVVAAIAFLMSVGGDVYGQMLLSAELAAPFEAGAYILQSQPIDWFVRALATVSAFGMARPRLTERQLRMEARIMIHSEDLAADAT